MQMTDTREIAGVRLADDIIQRIMAQANGRTVHAVRNLVGAYRGAVGMTARSDDPQWAEMADRNARKLQAFAATGNAEHLK